ncbi:zinc alcohol dehydrogenase [Ophiostoma piceae UAMH 11346]|uniref:Zinc alcohol dehydrogenase n=1 Tax=Ophiostoma piceae (strain UAMH 11346) TaxID=1262450 RepID=S3CZU6_OPHP1|nr:zinc alcohol dehydrogenase [Ophiostoma piceae UAMH 11346]
MTATSSSHVELPATMRAWVFDKIRNGLENALTLDASFPIPESFKNLVQPKAKADRGFVLVRVLAASVNPADYKLPELPIVGGLTPKRPAIPSMDFCGRVVNSTDPQFTNGQLVAGKTANFSQHGTLAEYTVAPAGLCANVPEGVSAEQAATIGVCGATAWTAVVPYIKKIKSGVAANQTTAVDKPRVFINGGSGGVGCFAIALAKEMGCHVTTTCSAGNADLVRKMGADDVIDYRSENVTEALILRATTTPGLPFDLAIDTAGLDFDLYKAGDKFLAPHGSFVQVAFKSFASSLSVGLRPSFLGGGQRSAPAIMTQVTPETFTGLLELMAAGKLTVPIEEAIPFEEAPRAYTQLKTHRTRGKVVVTIPDDN